MVFLLKFHLDYYEQCTTVSFLILLRIFRDSCYYKCLVHRSFTIDKDTHYKNNYHIYQSFDQSQTRSQTWVQSVCTIGMVTVIVPLMTTVIFQIKSSNSVGVRYRILSRYFLLVVTLGSPVFLINSLISNKVFSLLLSYIPNLSYPAFLRSHFRRVFSSNPL